MEIVKAFNDNNLHTEILIKGTHSDPLFRASDIGEILEIYNIRSSIQLFNETERHVHTVDTSTGPKQVTFLTEKGLYKLLFKSRKPIAEKFQNWVCDVIKELRLKGIYELKQQVEQSKLELSQLEEIKNKEIEEKLSFQQVVDNETFLLKEYAYSGPLVYIVKVKSFPNGEFAVKIGHSTKGIHDRYVEHHGKYEECLLLNCFSVHKSHEFEFFLHNHEEIRQNKLFDLPSHENEKELFLIGRNLTYQKLLKIINTSIHNFNYTVNELLKENEALHCKLMLYAQQKNDAPSNDNDKTNIDDLLQVVHGLHKSINILEKSIREILEKLNSQQTKVFTGFNEPLVTLGPRLQKINPETLQLVKVYETVTEAIKEDSTLKRPSINKAVEECTVYNGFRWLLVDRELNPNVVTDIKPTKITRVQNNGYIAQLNTNKTEILNVYIDRKTAAIENGYSSPSALDNPVKNFTITHGHYYLLYENCEEGMKNAFINRNGNKPPILYKDGVGQYNLNNELIQEFTCKYHCIQSLHISDKTLDKALNNNVTYNGYYFKYLGSKIKCFVE